MEVQKKVDEAEKKAPVTAPSVTDNELDSAFQAALQGDVEEKEDTPLPPEDTKGEKKEENEEEENEDKKPVTPEDQSEKSRLGRKVKRLEEKLDLLLTELERKEPKGKEEVEDLSDTDIVSTVEDVKKVLQKYETQRSHKQIEEDEKITKAQKGYEKAYVETLLDYKEDDDGNDNKDFDAIYKEMVENFNVKVTGNPETDASINFDRATAAFYKKAHKEKKVPVRGGSKIPIGTESPNIENKNSVKKVELDDVAKDYLERLGIPFEKAQEWLK